MTGTDREAMSREAVKLAQAYWDAREQFAFGTQVGSVDECVDLAIASKTHPVVLADSGDNPTAGGVGDRADVLAALIEKDAKGVVLAGITDKPATEAAYAAGVGETIQITIGATLDSAGSKPVAVTAKVARLLETENDTLREAVLQVGGIAVVVHSKRRPYHNIHDFTRLGLNPMDARIVVVKSGYLSPELAPIANPPIMALSPGVVDQYVERLPRLRKQVPTFPFDRGFDYEPKVVWSARSR